MSVILNAMKNIVIITISFDYAQDDMDIHLFTTAYLINSARSHGFTPAAFASSISIWKSSA